jgi:Mg2+ and Co2+ transporter CorA
MDITLPPDFKEFLRLLNTHGVEYLLIGGYAVGYHGYPRATNDMDIWIAIHPQNAERMVAVLRAFGFDTPDLSPDLFLQDHRSRVWGYHRYGLRSLRRFLVCNSLHVMPSASS